MEIKVFVDFFRGIEYTQNALTGWLNLDVTFSVSQFFASELLR